jgi:transposase InsO family protein
LAFSEALIEAGITGSIGSVGDALDNALMESTIGLYKTEIIRPRPGTWTGLAEVERATAEWVHWFNTCRLHHSIGLVAPIEYEAMYLVNTAFPTGQVALTQEPPGNPGRFRAGGTVTPRHRAMW